MPDVDLNALAEAIKNLLRTGLEGFCEVYDIDDVPGAIRGAREGEDPPQRHVEIEFARVDTFPSRRGSGRVSVPTFELKVTSHADSIPTVRKIRGLVVASLEHVAVDLPGGGTAGPFCFVVSEREDDDDRGWFGVDHFTFA